ncbi:hypothetical protein FA15DRAFT_586202, partial [Coprinopsis marcescibilis]
PMFLYEDYKYNESDPWVGFMRGYPCVKCYKHIFTSPSSADCDRQPTRAKRSSNSQLHDMKLVTLESLAYVAMHVKFTLSATTSFQLAEAVEESQKFYDHLLKFLRDPADKEEVNALLEWWNLSVHRWQ